MSGARRFPGDADLDVLAYLLTDDADRSARRAIFANTHRAGLAASLRGALWEMGTIALGSPEAFRDLLEGIRRDVIAELAEDDE